MNPQTVICRCCEITQEEILSAIQEGAASIDEVKRRTRAGMGPCQGKTCGPIIERILAQAAEEQVTPRISSMRAPVRPVTLATMARLAKWEGSGDTYCPSDTPSSDAASRRRDEPLPVRPDRGSLAEAPDDAN